MNKLRQNLYLNEVCSVTKKMILDGLQYISFPNIQTEMYILFYNMIGEYYILPPKCIYSFPPLESRGKTDRIYTFLFYWFWKNCLHWDHVCLCVCVCVREREREREKGRERERLTYYQKGFSSVLFCIVCTSFALWYLFKTSYVYYFAFGVINMQLLIWVTVCRLY